MTRLGVTMNWILKGEESILSFINKIGQLIIVTVLWLISCLPIITIGTACSAMYYTVVKVIRREHGYLHKEYMKAFKRNVKNGCIFTIGFIIWGLILYLNRGYVGHEGTLKSRYFILIYDLLIAITIGMAVYLFPNLSRFKLKNLELIKMSLHMAFRNLPITLLLIAGTFLCMIAIWFLPIFMTLLIPGFWCYISSYLIEKVLKLYMAKPVDGEELWFYQ